ncbi:hypothetical protein QJS04_geneDACA023560 [Acorus gramineus]|uniref:Agenet domain-containing protein n=1 Tax=Acorus gramineus TaxID=55184 RepID=A0AAV9BNV2_ACOGR|nr:hypothetical protein QJS04_geneDACA023560 [Acorus gramineus]
MGPNSWFYKGQEVEVAGDEEGLRGAWYEATVVRSFPSKGKVSLLYRTLALDDDPTKPLKETVHAARVRPAPPPTDGRGRAGPVVFGPGQAVDAFYNEGWWVGTVSEVRVTDDKGGPVRTLRYRVRFPDPVDEREFGVEELRAHLEWVGGEWVNKDSMGEKMEGQNGEEKGTKKRARKPLQSDKNKDSPVEGNSTTGEDLNIQSVSVQFVVEEGRNPNLDVQNDIERNYEQCNSPLQSSIVQVEKEITSVKTSLVAIPFREGSTPRDTSPLDSRPLPVLPFEKKSPVWNVFEDCKVIIEDQLKALTDLEKHGFDLQPERSFLNSLLRVKDKCEVYEDQINTLEEKVHEEKQKNESLDKEVVAVDDQLVELQNSISMLIQKKASLLNQQEMNTSNVDKLLDEIGTMKGAMLSVKCEFQKIVGEKRAMNGLPPNPSGDLNSHVCSIYPSEEEALVHHVHANLPPQKGYWRQLA